MKIISNGTGRGTKVFNDDGVEIKGLRSVTFHVVGPGPAHVHISPVIASLELDHADCPPPADSYEALERKHLGCATCSSGIYSKPPEPSGKTLRDEFCIGERIAAAGLGEFHWRGGRAELHHLRYITVGEILGIIDQFSSSNNTTQSNGEADSDKPGDRA